MIICDCGPAPLISMSMSSFAVQFHYKVSTCFERPSRMKSAKTDRLLRAAMGLLMVGLVYVIYIAIHERIVVAGDDAPKFTIRTESGREISVPNFGGKVLVLNFWA